MTSGYFYGNFIELQRSTQGYGASYKNNLLTVEVPADPHVLANWADKLVRLAQVTCLYYKSPKLYTLGLVGGAAYEAAKMALKRSDWKVLNNESLIHRATEFLVKDRHIGAALTYLGIASLAGHFVCKLPSAATNLAWMGAGFYQGVHDGSAGAKIGYVAASKAVNLGLEQLKASISQGVLEQAMVIIFSLTSGLPGGLPADQFTYSNVNDQHHLTHKNSGQGYVLVNHVWQLSSS